WQNSGMNMLSTFSDRGAIHSISQEAIDVFWEHNDQMSLRSNQKGLNYALEGYIHHFIVEKVDEKLKLQAKIYRSQCPHLKLVPLKLRFLAQNMRKG
ncbi:hypothetical protein P3465_23660, partial [Vibrio parahaemolyticus]|nr:hypothetical protein [Vibrio parahaemolyticus]